MGDKTLQWAAVNTVLELIRTPPQNDLVDPICTIATSHGYSFLEAGCPPTIRFLNTCGTPHLQPEDGGRVVGGGGGGAGGRGGGLKKQLREN